MFFLKKIVISFSRKESKLKINIVIYISPPIPYLAKFWFFSYGPKCCQPIQLQDSLKYKISRKKWMMKFNFGMQINIEVLGKLILSFWVCVTRHAQSTQNKKFRYLSNISWNAWGIKLIFCPQIDTKVFYKVARVPKATALQYLCNISRKTWRMELDFLPADKRQRFLQIDISILGVCGQVCPNYPK